MVHELRAQRDDLRNKLERIERQLFEKTQMGWIGLIYIYVECLSGETAFKICVAPISSEAESHFSLWLDQDIPNMFCRDMVLHIEPRGRLLMLGHHCLGPINFGEVPHEIGANNLVKTPKLRCYATYRKKDVETWIDSMKDMYGVAKEKPSATVEEILEDDEV